MKGSQEIRATRMEHLPWAVAAAVVARHRYERWKRDVEGSYLIYTYYGIFIEYIRMYKYIYTYMGLNT